MVFDSVDKSFESAHLLSFHKGKCANLHGHSYKVTVRFRVKTDDNEKYIDDYDFSNLKKKVNEICERFDHAIIFSDYPLMSEREDELYEWAEKYSMKYIVLPFYSTSEGIARYFLNELLELMGLDCISVSVSECKGSQSTVVSETAFCIECPLDKDDDNE